MQNHYDNAYFIGLSRPSCPGVDQMNQMKIGLCPDLDTKIEPEDLLIFIGAKSQPTGSMEVDQDMTIYNETAKRIIKESPPVGKSDGKLKRNVLVCGWRDVWTTHPKRFHQRIMVRLFSFFAYSFVFCPIVYLRI